MNFLETGTIGVKSGPLMAAPDKFSITVQGKGGHGAMPHETVDAMLVASMVCVALFYTGGSVSTLHRSLCRN